MNVIDLFSGGGFFSLGFDYLDSFNIIYALDNWDIACETYKANFPYVDIDCRDALEVKPKEIPQTDIILGGPPCQEFTVAKNYGHKRTFDTSLIEWFITVVEHLKPQYWIMENVPAVIDFVNGRYTKKIYKMSDYGVPQLRKRLFYGKYEEPTKQPTEIIFPTVINEAGGFNYRPPNLGIRLGAVFRRRALLHEAMLVQTIPLDYVLCGTLSDKYEMIGNAVPPLMAYRFAQAIERPHQMKIPLMMSHITNKEANE